MIGIANSTAANKDYGFSPKLPIKVHALETGQKHVEKVMQTRTIAETS